MNPQHPLPLAMTGDRPTGALHLGHLVGSLANRLALQKTHQLTVLIADTQAQSDFGDNPKNLQENILSVMEDYLSIGLDPNKVSFVLQSQAPSLFALTCLLQNFATLSQMEKNPTIRQEVVQKGFDRNIPLSFLSYPVSQVSDMIGLGGGVIPVGEDQLPIIELGNDIIGKLNHLGLHVPRLTPLVSSCGRLTGICGKQKMSKSLNNAILLRDDKNTLLHKVMKMYTDPNHLKVSDPGQVEGNTVFEYLDAFDDNKEEVVELKQHYQKGGLGDAFLKKRLHGVLQDKLAFYNQFRGTHNLDQIKDILRHGSLLGEHKACALLGQLRERLFPSLF